MQTPAGITVGWTPPHGMPKWEFYSREILLGITITCAQVPESVAFAFMAHIKPPVALHAAWMVGFICSMFNGRPGMVNGATGAFAAIIGNFVSDCGTGKNGQGVETLFPSVMLAGVLMVVAAAWNLPRFIQMLPAPVMIGFCNGLAIVIGLAQLHPFVEQEHGGEGECGDRRLGGGGGGGGHWKQGAEMWWMLLICFTSMIIMEFVPKIPHKAFKVIPSSLFAILSAIIIEFAIVEPLGYKTNTIRDVSEFTSDTAVPIPFFVDHASTRDYDLSRLWEGDGPTTIVIQGILLMVVGTIEELLTSEVVESFVKTPSDGDRTVTAMGFANLFCGFMGTMGGNAMIGLSTVNVLNGGRGRVGPNIAAFGIMVCCMGAYPLLNFIPVAALSGIMIVVVLHTFKWFSLKMALALVLPKQIRNYLGWHYKIPRYEVVVIVVVTILSNWPKGTNIAYAVIAGSAICALAYSWNSGQQLEVSISEQDGTKYYHIDGPLFFASANRVLKILTPDTDPENVEVLFGSTTVMDFTAIDVMHKLTCEYANKKKKISFSSLNESSVTIIAKANRFCRTVQYSRPLERQIEFTVKAELEEVSLEEIDVPYDEPFIDSRDTAPSPVPFESPLPSKETERTPGSCLWAHLGCIRVGRLWR